MATTTVTTVPSRANGWAGSAFQTVHKNFDGTLGRITLALANNQLSEANRYYYGVREEALAKLDAGDENAWIPELLFERCDELMSEYRTAQQNRADLTAIELFEMGMHTCPRCNGEGLATTWEDGPDGKRVATRGTCTACGGKGVGSNANALQAVRQRMIAKFGAMPLAKETLKTAVENSRYQF